VLQESPALATIDDTLARVIGIRICVAVIADRARSGKPFTADDWRELHQILDLTDGIQDDHLQLRAVLSRAYQQALRT
jgi:hypothetical protein